MVGGKRAAPPQADDEIWLDQDARGLAEDAARAGAENASGAVRFCFSTQVAIVMEPDRSRADVVAGRDLKGLDYARGARRLVTHTAPAPSPRAPPRPAVPKRPPPPPPT